MSKRKSPGTFSGPICPRVNTIRENTIKIENLNLEKMELQSKLNFQDYSTYNMIENTIPRESNIEKEVSIRSNSLDWEISR